MAKTIRARAKLKDDLTEVRMLIKHPMETGLRKDKSGNPIPAHFIQSIEATSNGQTVFSAQLNTAVSKDPYLAFSFTGAQQGDSVNIAWLDNQGNTDTTEVNIK